MKDVREEGGEVREEDGWVERGERDEVLDRSSEVLLGEGFEELRGHGSTR